MTDLFSILEYIGVAAFAMSGVLVGIEYGFDYIGIIFLAVVAAVGGGFIRDLALGIIPPSCLTNPKYLIVAIATAIVSIIIALILKGKTVSNKNREFFRKTIGISDALGLGLFSITSVQLSLSVFPNTNIVLAVFVSVITATGGGIIRDLLANRKPLVMRKEVYALAAMAGSVIYFLLVRFSHIRSDFISIGCIILVFIIRLWAMRKQLNLPKFRNTED